MTKKTKASPEPIEPDPGPREFPVMETLEAAVRERRREFDRAARALEDAQRAVTDYGRAKGEARLQAQKAADADAQRQRVQAVSEGRPQ
jgi:hypothetical protein